MDKYDLVFDIIEHPDKYTSEQLAEILSEPETREIYNLLSKADTAVEAQEEFAPDEVDAEWRDFQRCHFKPRFRFMWLAGRAAGVAIFLLCSLVAVAIGVVVKVAVFERNDAPEMTNAAEPAVPVVTADTVAVGQDTIAPTAAPILFENATLCEIISSIEKIYNVKADFKDAKAGELHLYYRLDPANSLSETVEQLNAFEQINIRIDGTTLIIG